MKQWEYDRETIRLAEEADLDVTLHGPMTRLSEMLYFCFDEHSPWIRPSDYIFDERIEARYERFSTVSLDDCDPSYNTNHNYDPPENIYDCYRSTDKLDGDWYEYHNCPKYKNDDRHGWL